MKRFVMLIALLVILVSCASVPVEQSAMQGEGALTAVHALQQTYERRDLEAFLEQVSPFFPDREAFRRAIASTFGTYTSIDFAVQNVRMLIMVEYQGNIKAVFTWAAEWMIEGGKVLKDGGRVTLVLDPGTYKLLAIEGKNPFVPTEPSMPVN